MLNTGQIISTWDSRWHYLLHNSEPSRFNRFDVENFTYFILQIISAVIRLVLAPEGEIRTIFVLEL